MGQSGIPMLNKVGHSMFWNSIWDQKIYYSRLLKEDIFLNKFFTIVLSDSMSINLINFKRKKLIFCKNYNYNIDMKKHSFYNFLLVNNKVNCYSSKLWILKYQKWVIIYNFVYVIDLNKIKFNRKDKNLIFNNNLFYLFKCYNNSFVSFKNKYSNFKNQIFHINF